MKLALLLFFLKNGAYWKGTWYFVITKIGQPKNVSLCWCYNPRKVMINEHLNKFVKGLDSCLSHYDNILIIDGLNSEIIESSMHEFFSLYNLNNLYNEPICYKNPCIDLVLASSPRSFQTKRSINSFVPNAPFFYPLIASVKTGLSDFRRLVVTVLTHFQPMFHFCKPWKHQKPNVLWCF